MKIIAAAGLARSGKNTFIDITRDILITNGYDVNRIKQYSFAEQVRAELASFLQNTCNIDVWTSDDTIKKSIRPLLVWHATFWRERDPLHWVNKVEIAVNNDKHDIDVALITDLRYVNECRFVQSNGGNVIHIKRYSTHNAGSPSWNYVRGISDNDNTPIRVFDDAPNTEEAKNDPLVAAMANLTIEWENRQTEDAIKDQYLRTIVLQSLNDTKLFNVSGLGILV